MAIVRTEFDKKILLKKSEFQSHGATYYCDKRKKPVAYSTGSELITLRMFSEKFGSLLNIADAINKGKVFASKGEIKVIEILLSHGEKEI